MRNSVRAALLALMLASVPACASLKLDNPVVVAKTIDQKAYAAIETYAAALEEATDLVSDPATPAALKATLANAEAAATPAVETLKIAVVTYLRAKADYQAAVSADAGALQKTSAALNAAASHLQAALRDAEAPIGALQALLRKPSSR